MNLKPAAPPPADSDSIRSFMHRAERLLIKRVAHELSNGLAGVVMALEVASESDSMDAARTWIDTAKAGAATATAANERLRRLLRRPDPEPTPVDLAPLLRQAIHGVTEDCPGVIRLQLSPGMPSACVVRVEERQLLAVIVHLILHGVSALPLPAGGEVIIHLRTLSQTGTQSANHDGAAAMAEVTIQWKRNAVRADTADVPCTGHHHAWESAATVANAIIAAAGGHIALDQERIQLLLPILRV